jgi:type I restriction enzyme S subunit
MDWKTKKLSDVLDIQNGYAFDSKQFSSEEGMPLIRIRDISNGLKTVTNYAGEYKSIYVVRKGDFLIGMDGEFRCYEWKGEDALLNQRVCRLQNFSNELSAKFLSYGINKYLQDIEDVTGFTTVKHISASQIKNIEFPIPPIPEQQRIVAILDQAFADIEKARANAEKNLKNARELFDSYLNQVFSQRGEGWVERPLDSFSNIVNGFSFKSGDFSPSNKVKSIKITNVGVYDFVEESDNYLPQDFLDKYSRYQAYEGDIVVALTRTIISSGLKVAVVPKSYNAALINQRVAAVQVNEEIMPKEMLQAFLSTSMAIDYVKSNVSELMQPNLSIKDLKAFPVPVPPSSKKQVVAKNISNIKLQKDQLVAKYTTKLVSLDELKKSLLQKAFSGELTQSKGIAV